LKRLYRDWSVHDALPREEIPPDKSIKQLAHPAPAARRVPRWLVLIAGVMVLLLFIAVGFIIKLST
jgi:hypothetical protein